MFHMDAPAVTAKFVEASTDRDHVQLSNALWAKLSADLPAEVARICLSVALASSVEATSSENAQSSRDSWLYWAERGSSGSSEVRCSVGFPEIVTHLPFIGCYPCTPFSGFSME